MFFIYIREHQTMSKPLNVLNLLRLRLLFFKKHEFKKREAENVKNLRNI